MKIELRQLAFSRSGDKGEDSNVMVAPYDERDFDWLCEQLTVDVVADRFGSVVRGPITRYELPGSKILNFVMERALEGGVSRSLALDAHGKSRASLILTVTFESTSPPPSLRV